MKINKFLLMSIMSVLLLTTFVNGLTLVTDEIENIDDTYINEVQPNSNQEDSPTVLRASNGAGADRHILMKFDLGELDIGDLISAKLRLNLLSNGLDAGEGFSISSHYVEEIYSWDETTVTWDSRPSTGLYNQIPSDTLSFDSTSQLGYYVWDLKNIINEARASGDLTVSIYLKTTDSVGSPDGITDTLVFADAEHPNDGSPILQIITETTSVNPEETIYLPQVISDIEPDDIGLERTYLFCTWGIEDIGETASPMSGNICPENEIEYTFDGDANYLVNIQAFDIFWNSTQEEWQHGASSPYVAGELNVVFDMEEPPEPDTDFFNNIIEIILNELRGLLCDMFPWLGFCD